MEMAKPSDKKPDGMPTDAPADRLMHIYHETGMRFLSLASPRMTDCLCATSVASYVAGDSIQSLPPALEKTSPRGLYFWTPKHLKAIFSVV